MKVPFNKQSLFSILIISICVLTAWSSILQIPFLNDDFQILSFHHPHTFLDCFSPFWNKDISGIYWRPLSNIFHSLIIFLFGYSAVPFRAVSLLLYVTLSISLFRFIKIIGIESKISTIITILFSILTTHELALMWIAGNGDVLVSIFILNAATFYFKYLNGQKTAVYYYFIFFILSILSKESAYSAVLLPLAFFLLETKPNKNVKTMIYSISISILLILISLIYRYSNNLGNPFQSYSQSTFISIENVKNFIGYILLSFFSAHSLELFSSFYNSTLFFISFLCLSVVLLFFFFKFLKKNGIISNKNFWFGLGWFIIFIVPACAFLKRWYVLSASLGLFIALSAFISDLTALYVKKYFKIYLVLLFLIFSFIIYQNFLLIEKWKYCGQKTNFALNSLISLKINTPKLTVWAAPDKIEDVNSMKIGLQQAVEWFCKNKNIDVFSPVRTELFENFKFKIYKKSDSEFFISLINGRFIPEYSTKINTLKIFNFEKSTKDYQFYISSFYDNSILLSNLNISIEPLNSSMTYIYFDGNEFRRLPIK
ncbi:MAG: hypothetical protein NT007_11695 [Candidatus Kapabacteria bacterium]|nr:hypothetical protein [Candidatus Kapabacteria bacterium]